MPCDLYFYFCKNNIHLWTALFQKVCVQDSISHTVHSHSSTHHWLWSIFCVSVLPEQSNAQESFHHVKCRYHHSSNPSTFQSLQSTVCILVHIEVMHTSYVYTCTCTHIVAEHISMRLWMRYLFLPYRFMYVQMNVLCVNHTSGTLIGVQQTI